MLQRGEKEPGFYLREQFKLIKNYKEFVLEKVLIVLTQKHRSRKQQKRDRRAELARQKIESEDRPFTEEDIENYLAQEDHKFRSTFFIIREMKELKKFIEGTHPAMTQTASKKVITQDFQSKFTQKRKAALLQQQPGVIPQTMQKESPPTDLMSQVFPENEVEEDDEANFMVDENLSEAAFKNGFMMWLEHFYKKYLDFESDLDEDYTVTPVQRELFIIQNEGIFSKMAPDIGGMMTKKIFESEKALGYQ